MQYYVSTPGEDLETAKARYRRSGISAASSSLASAHKAAQFLFTLGQKYNILSESGNRIVLVGRGEVRYSYWDAELRRPVPAWFDMSVWDKKLLNISSAIR